MTKQKTKNHAFNESRFLEGLEYRGIEEAIILLDDIKVPSCYIYPFAKSVKSHYGIEFDILEMSENKTSGVFMCHEYQNQQIATLRRNK